MNLKYINMKWIIVLLLVFISGCTVPFLNYEFGGKSVSGDDASGLIMNFDYNKPPSGRVLSEGDSFQVVINLRNTGDKAISGELCVSDSLLHGSYGGVPDQECKYVSLGGAEEGIEPSEQKIYFPDSMSGYEYYNLDPYFSQTNNVIASFGYEVDSNSAAQLCIKRDMDVKLPPGVVCLDVETLSGKKIQNMKAPIVISSIEKDIVSSGGNARVKVEITLRKITDGEIEDIVSYDVSLGGYSFNCGSRSGQLLFDKNEKVIKCNTNINIGQDYINQLLEVKLHYKFNKRISTQFELKKEE